MKDIRFYAPQIQGFFFSKNYFIERMSRRARGRKYSKQTTLSMEPNTTSAKTKSQNCATQVSPNTRLPYKPSPM